MDRAAAGNRHGAALEYLARIDALPIQHTGIRARVLFDRASIHAKLDNPRKALELLEKLLTAHAADPTAADAAEKSVAYRQKKKTSSAKFFQISESGFRGA